MRTGGEEKMQFSDKLKQARQQHHLTQMQVGTQLHVSAKTISSWENGRSFPDISTLVSISDLYQIFPNYILFEYLTDFGHLGSTDHFEQFQTDTRVAIFGTTG